MKVKELLVHLNEVLGDQLEAEVHFSYLHIGIGDIDKKEDLLTSEDEVGCRGCRLSNMQHRAEEKLKATLDRLSAKSSIPPTVH